MFGKGLYAVRQMGSGPGGLISPGSMGFVKAVTVRIVMASFGDISWVLAVTMRHGRVGCVSVSYGYADGLR